jgi:nucleotide-binding universal stress UspA family protein
MLEDGDTVDAILGFCKKGSYDLLVIGAYGHSKIRELILGNTTVQLMRKVTCPVLLCR